MAADPVAAACMVAAEHASRRDEAASFPAEALAAMRAGGLLGLMVPRAHGGSDGTLSDLADVTIRLARVDMSVALIFAMHCQQVTAIARYGSERLRGEVLPAVARGDLYIASVTTEPGTGGHLLTSESVARIVDGELSINRDAPIVTGGRHADAFLISQLAPDAAGPASVDLVYASRDQVKVEVLGEWRPLGMRATESVPMRLTGSVPPWQVVGGHGGFRSIATELFAPVAHVGWSAAWLGTAAGAYSRVIRHIRSDQGRRYNPSSDLLLTSLARTRGRLDTVHALLRHTVAVMESVPEVSATPFRLLINTLKTTASRECYEAVDELIELVGLRHGYMPQSPLFLERALRDLRSASLNYGNDRLLRANGTLALMDTGVCLA